MKRNIPLEGSTVIIVASLWEKKSLIDHLKSCKKVPGYEQRSEEELKPHKCPDCFRCYVNKKDMQKHHRKVHPDKLLVPGGAQTVKSDAQIDYITTQTDSLGFCHFLSLVVCTCICRCVAVWHPGVPG